MEQRESTTIGYAYYPANNIHRCCYQTESYSVPTGQGILEKVREFEWSGNVRERSGENIFGKVREKSGKMNIGDTRCQIFRLKCIKFDFRRW